MTIREQLEREMDKMEIEEMGGENADSEKFNKDNIFDNDDCTNSVSSN